MVDTRSSLIERWRRMGVRQDVLDAFRGVRRERFIPPEYRQEAYDDHPLPIGHGQTISQPTTIATMLDALEVRPEHKVLEIGAGSGYTAALLSLLAKEVISTEIVPELTSTARRNTRDRANVRIERASGWGHPQAAPFDRIMVNAACREVYPQLLEQLKVGGIMLIPVGEGTQQMLKITKTAAGIRAQSLGEYLFVPYLEEGDKDCNGTDEDARAGSDAPA